VGVDEGTSDAGVRGQRLPTVKTQGQDSALAGVTLSHLGACLGARGLGVRRRRARAGKGKEQRRAGVR